MGSTPWKHIYNEDGVLERVVPIPDFTSITPVIISGKIIGFMNEKEILFLLMNIQPA